MNGEKIYFRKKILKGWKGHVVVLEQYGQSALVRQGGSYFWMHPSNLQGEKLTQEKTGRQRHYKIEKTWPTQTLESTSIDLWKNEEWRTWYWRKWNLKSWWWWRWDLSNDYKDQGDNGKRVSNDNQNKGYQLIPVIRS